MAYTTTGHVTLGQLETALTRTKTEYEAAITTAVENGGSTSSDVATDDEVSEMLDTVFAAE